MFISTFRIRPKAIKVMISIVPPYDINGRGAPTTGIIPVTIAIFIKKCKNKKQHKPIAKYLPN